MNRNDQMKCFINDGVLTILIGVDVIAKAIELDPELSEYDEQSGEWIAPEITDVDTFVNEVMHALKADDEDGTTLIHSALDTAAINAIEMGAEGVKLPDQIIEERRKQRRLADFAPAHTSPMETP